MTFGAYSACVTICGSAAEPGRAALNRNVQARFLDRTSRSDIAVSISHFVKGVGKTTLVQKACEALLSSGVGVEGFYTEEVRERGRRTGFDVVTMTGERGHLSRIRDVTSASPGRREYTVGQYVVDLPAFEALVLPLFRNVGLADGGNKKVFVIDEIGKMELFSQSFIRAVRQILDSSSCTVLGTIPIPKGKPLGLVEEVRSSRDVRVFAVTKENRNALLQDIVGAVQECLKPTS
ncbi:cancer-related nucleoside-triphosphatase isoform X1 [Cynoglossus semilaevis]|uniref:cancer-related nucleoside-triphosphatase isoform X1 n=1 Tax=Cynoglossus semilaevis TaxID=244447 RepID=UPI0004980682|nr:cancer-related nucleoside-triphosphatase isoform X1 [Cynoglossus semilaevis]